MARSILFRAIPDLAYPSHKKSVSYNDGNIKEWKHKNIVSSGENIELYMKADDAIKEGCHDIFL